jgi:nucleoside-diphosphate-sugar epimerase
MSNVIGNGLLGRSFRRLALPEALYFCSGVSDSKETRASEFDRERELLMSVFDAGQEFSRFVYFSSIMAPDRGTEYFEHKYKMEQLVKSLFPGKYLIIRLPQVVGLVNNTTLFPVLVHRIQAGLPVSVQRYATRSLIDVDDVVRITNKLIEFDVKKVEVNCMPDEVVSVSDIVDFISDEIESPVDRIYVNEGVAQDADRRILRQYLSEEDPVLLPGYTRSVVAKYAEKLLADDAKGAM